MIRQVAILTTAFLVATTVASAQTSSAPAQPQAPGATQQAQSAGAASQAPSAQPAGHRVLQAKSQEELKAYQDAATKTDPAQAEAAADDFAAKYPNSELKAALYIRVMSMFAQSNNNEKVISVGRQAIAADPTNPVPLVQVASALAESTRDSDLDREQRLAEAAKDAQAAIDNINTGLLIPPNADPTKVEAAKHSILTMAYDSLGMVNMSRNDYAAAISNLQKALNESQGNPEAVLYLRLSVAQDKLQQYPQALDSANKAVQYSQPGSAALNLAKQQQDRLQKLISAGSSGAGATPTAPSSTPSSPANPAAAPTTPATPH
jgi:tetratricopeptide (TPR) repeat protein